MNRCNNTRNTGRRRWLIIREESGEREREKERETSGVNARHLVPLLANHGAKEREREGGRAGGETRVNVERGWTDTRGGHVNREPGRKERASVNHRANTPIVTPGGE